MLEVQNLSKSFYGSKAVDDVTFRVESGEIVGFLGPNGAGKTTTMRMITGFLPPTSGTVSLDGVDVATPSRSRRSAASGTCPRRSPSTPRCGWPSS